MKNKLILATIVLSQFACGSLWFASNGVMHNLQTDFHLHADAMGHLTSFVQFGFIIGTLIFAFLTISDRFSPSRIFFICAVAGAIFNGAIIIGDHFLLSLLILRFFTGFCLAGIYPVGMKIAADYHEAGLGKALGFLVGALVLGTALPHLLKDLTTNIAWRYVILFTSLFSLAGGLAILILVPDGPYRKPSPHIDLKAFFKIFSEKKLRAAAFGYFGHMWELYTFWAFIPFIFIQYNKLNDINLNVPLLSFLTIGVGSLACAIGGIISQRSGSRNVAIYSLIISGFCCLFSPLLFSLNPIVLIAFMLIWGMFVVADSPQFSTLVARYAASTTRGTALTIVNSIGFALTIFSIQLFTQMKNVLPIKYGFLLLTIGPIFGIINMNKLEP